MDKRFKSGISKKTHEIAREVFLLLFLYSISLWIMLLKKSVIEPELVNFHEENQKMSEDRAHPLFPMYFYYIDLYCEQCEVDIENQIIE